MDIMAAVCLTALALIAAGYGLGLICYERGWLHGREDALHPEGETIFKGDDDGRPAT